MQFEALQVFCDVVRHRSFSKAAAANELTQSAVSQIVLQLERRLGVQLLNRSTRPLQLTPLGQTYYEGCKGFLDNYRELEAAIKHAHAEMSAVLQVAAIYSVGLSDMGQLVERFTSLHPHVKVHLEYLHPERVYERVLEGSADLGLVSFPRRSRKLTSIPWRDEPMVLACSPNHPLASAESVAPTQLNGARYVGFDQGLVIRKQVDRFLREHDVAVDVVMEFDNIENIKQAVEINAGIALLPQPTLRREVQSGTLVAVPLRGCRFVRPLGIIHRRHQRLSTAALHFVDLLRQPEPNGRVAASNSVNSPRTTGVRAQLLSGPAQKRRVSAPSRSVHTGKNGAVRAPKRTV